MNRAISKTVYKTSDFISWQRSNSLVLSPSFQRRPVWPKAAKSLLIDTVVRGLPMPIIFLRERTDLQTLEPIREVVDGQQRLRTLLSFIEPNCLKDFEEGRDGFFVKKIHNEEIADKTFHQLEAETRKHILNYDFSVHVLPSDTEDREVLQIFARMNSSGVKLNRQELRNAEFFGEFKTLAYILAYEQLERWRSWKIFNEESIARMLEVEETSEFIRFMLSGVQANNQDALDRLYKDNEDEFPHKLEVTRRYRTIMDRIDETLGPQLKSSAFSRRPLFNTLFTFYYDLIYGLGSPLTKRKAEPLPPEAVQAVSTASDKILHGKMSEQLAKVLRGATANKQSRTARLNYLRRLLKSAQA
jgi:uncharacterized protein with ParB-like and HNH nuclease domain